MKMISESALKARISECLREVEATGEELLVTNNGEMVLKIISYRRETRKNESKINEHGSSS